MTPQLTQNRPQLLVAIDPSIGSLGYAVLDIYRLSLPLIQGVGLIEQQSSRDFDYHTRAGWMADTVCATIEGLCTVSSLMDIVIEVPANWSGERGQVSKDNEAVQKLYFTTGCIMAALRYGLPSHCLRSIWYVSPSAWKGSSPKPAMVRRALRYAEAQKASLKANVKHDSAEALLLARYAVEKYVPCKNEYEYPLCCYYMRGQVPSSTFTVTEFLTNV